MKRTRRDFLLSSTAIGTVLSASAEARSVGHGLVRAGGAGSAPPPVQIISTMEVAGSSSAASFQANTANADVGAITVEMSPASPLFAGTVSLDGGGHNTEGFHLTSSTLPSRLQAPPGGLTAGAYTDVVIRAQQAGLADLTINPTLTATNFPISTSGTLFPQAFFLETFGGGPTLSLTPTLNTPNSVSLVYVVHGTVTINATPSGFPNGTVIAQFLLDNLPLGPKIVGPPFNYSWNTTGTADGTHAINIQLLDTPAGYQSGYNIVTTPVAAIILNGSPSGISPSVAQTVPSMGFGVGAYTSLNSMSDFLPYPGSPSLVTNTPYPNAYPTIHPATTDSRYNTPTNAALLRNRDLLWAESPNEYRWEEYAYTPAFETTLNGGVIVSPYNPQFGGIALSEGYDVVVHQNGWDGARLDCETNTFVEYVEVPDGSGFYGAELNGRISKYTWDGAVTTVFGFKRDRTVLNIDQNDLTVPEGDVTRVAVGTCVGFDDLGGCNDLCVDPNDPTIIYVACTLANFIAAVNLGTMTATIYAGIPTSFGPGGYVDNSNPALAQFNQPYSICMVHGNGGHDPKGTMYVADQANNAIRKIAQVSPGVAGAVTTLIGGSLVTQPADFTAFAAGFATYDPVSVSPFTAAYATQPSFIRMTSNLGFLYTQQWSNCIRYANLSSNVVTRAGVYGADNPSPTPGASIWAFQALECDWAGTMGPVDDFFMFATPSYLWRYALDGSYAAQWAAVGNSSTRLRQGFVPYIQSGIGHYPWSVAVSRVHGRIIVGGIGSGNPMVWRIGQQAGLNGATYTDFEDLPPSYDAYYNGEREWICGTCTVSVVIGGAGSNPLLFPRNSRPSFWTLMGPSGVAHFGSWPGKNTFDDLFTLPVGNTDLHPGDPANAGTLCAWIQGGMGGAYPRPEFTGRSLRDLIFFIRFTAAAGAWPVIATIGPTNPDVTAPVITITAVTHSGSSLTATWNTDKPTYGVLCAGSAAQQTYPDKYNLFAFESFTPGVASYKTTGHTATITNLPSVTPFHYSVQVKDIAGNTSYTLDGTIA